jgi:hypothetical protein
VPHRKLYLTGLLATVALTLFTATRRGARLDFATGLVDGIVWSAVVWFVAFSPSLSNATFTALISVAFVAAKLAFGVTLAARPNWRPMGLGILISVGVGGLIFLSTCSVSMF